MRVWPNHLRFPSGLTGGPMGLVATQLKTAASLRTRGFAAGIRSVSPKKTREWERLKPAIGLGDIKHIGGSPQTLHTRTCFGADRTGGTGVTRLAPPQPCYRSHMRQTTCTSTGAILFHAPGRTVTASLAAAPVTRCRRAEKVQAARPIPSCFQASAPPPKPGRPGCPCGGRCAHYPAPGKTGDRFSDFSFKRARIPGLDPDEQK